MPNGWGWRWQPRRCDGAIRLGDAFLRALVGAITASAAWARGSPWGLGCLAESRGRAAGNPIAAALAGTAAQ